MHRRYFGEPDKQALLDSVKDCRDSTVEAFRKLDPNSDEYRACNKLTEAIDDLVGVLTGDREHFHLKGGFNNRC
jgi:hypothetical protein